MPVAILCILLASPLGNGEKGLDELLREHFLARSTAKRRGIQKKILSTDGLTIKALASTIRKLNLWEPQPAGEREIAVRLRRGQSSEKHVLVRIPQGYKPDKAWPLIITLHGRGQSAGSMLQFTKKILSDRADEFIVAAPQDLGPIGFTEPGHVVAGPRNLVNGLRKHFHIDSDRVYLIGYSLGSHNAWMATVMHSDCFAGVVPLATPLQVVGDTLIYEELLPNCRNTAILFCWGRQDTLGPDGQPHPQGGNAALNRHLSGVIDGLDFKRFAFVEYPDKDHFGIEPPPDKFSSLLDYQRRKLPKHVRQVYRLIEQSRAYWLASERLQGKPLPNDQLRIPVEPGEDPRIAQRKYIIAQLGLVEGRCKGRTIDLTTRRTGRVVLYLSDALVDLDKPVRIIRNKRERFRGRIPRHARVMLEEAAQSWDFDRLFTARVVIPLAGKVKFGYPPDKKGRRGK